MQVTLGATSSRSVLTPYREFAVADAVGETSRENRHRLLPKLADHRFKGGEQGGLCEASLLDTIECGFRKCFPDVSQGRTSLVRAFDPVV